MKQRGAVLIQVLVIVAILVPLVATIQFDVRSAMQRTAVQFQVNQARQYLISGETIAVQKLWADREENQVDSDEENWLEPIGPFRLDAGREGATWPGDIDIQISDLSGLLNINGLHQTAEVQSLEPEQFLRWFEKHDLSVDWAQHIVQWFDSSESADFTYEAKTPAYQRPLRMMTDLSELRRIEGYKEEAYESLWPLMAALASDSALNVNFASAATLQSKLPMLSEETVDAIVFERDSQPFVSVEEVFQRVPVDSAIVEKIPLERLSVESTYFKVQTMVSLDSQPYYLSSIVKRDSDNHLQIVSRQFEPFFRKESE